MSKPKSDSLFHFTKNIDYLKSILLNGFYPRYCLEDMTWFGLDQHLAYPIVCFCDIPLSRINEHADFYGNYGIGLTKEWGLKNKLNPVIYCEAKGLVPEIADFLFRTIEGESDKHKEERDNTFFKLMKIVKPLKGKMIVSGEFIEKVFHQECEWRYTPSNNIVSAILQSDFEQTKESENSKIEKHKLSFLPSDLKYIFVKEDSDIPTIVDFINNNLGQYPLNDLKILNSRIISLKTIEIDI